jgi:hypothetical protein
LDALGVLMDLEAEENLLFFETLEFDIEELD